jgi:F-box/leucine-rich repeat protein 2/20
LKGVQAVSSEVIRALARSSHHLETLDVSRCWDISLCDILVFIKMLTAAQAARIRGLRISGLKAYGTASADFLPLIMEKLVNLETLDLLGCTHIRDIDMVRACVALDNRQTPLTLRHLILSGCTSLSASIFGSMQGRFSALTRLELASLPDMFTENGEGEREFHKFLEGLPSLEKLDLEGTGTKGGVNDKMLEALIPARGETSRLIDLQIGSAKGVTPEGMIRFIRACPSLRNFEADVSDSPYFMVRADDRIPLPRMQSCASFTVDIDIKDLYPSSTAEESRPYPIRILHQPHDPATASPATKLCQWHTSRLS